MPGKNAQTFTNKRCAQSYKMWWQNGKFGTVNWQASYCTSHIHITSCFISHICVLYTAQRPPPSDIHSSNGRTSCGSRCSIPCRSFTHGMQCYLLWVKTTPLQFLQNMLVQNHPCKISRKYWLLPGNSCVSPSTNPKHNQKIAKARIGQISGINGFA